MGHESNFALTIARLARHMKGVIDQFAMKSEECSKLDDIADLARLQDELVAARRRLSVCSKAAYYFRNNNSISDNSVTGDAIQIMVPTNGPTAKRSTASLEGLYRRQDRLEGLSQ